MFFLFIGTLSVNINFGNVIMWKYVKMQINLNKKYES